MKRKFFQAALGAGLIAGFVAGCATEEAKFEEPTAPAKAVETPNSPKTPYRFPLVSIGGKFSALPPAVQNTVRAQVGSQPLADIEKDTTSGTTVYKIYFENVDLFPPMYIAPDGSVLNPDLTLAVAAPAENTGVPSEAEGPSLKTSDLPAPVMKTIQARAPSGEIAHISKEVWGSRDIYIVSFKDPAHNRRLYVAADGTLAGGTHNP